MKTAALFAVPVLGKWLVYAPLQGVSVLVNQSALACLAGRSPAAESEVLLGLQQELSAPPQVIPSPPRGLVSPEFIGLIPTRACNLACGYCAFGAARSPRGRTMSFAVATAAVDWMVERAVSLGRSTVDVHFFGGEPFLAPDVVDVAVHRTRAQAARRGLRPWFEVATNGCFDEERCRFVGAYFDAVVLSFDGAGFQDEQRPFRGGAGTFDLVTRNARALRASAAELSVRITVTERSLPELESITEWICRELSPATIVLESLQPTEESRQAGLVPPDPWRFAAMWLRVSARAAKWGVKPVYAAASLEGPRHSFCPVGRDSLIVGPDGSIRACYLPRHEWERRGLDLLLGQIEAAGRIRIDERAVDRVRDLTASHERCRRCLGRWHCAGGCRVNQSYPGCETAYNAFCIQTRIITVCALMQGMGQDSLAEELVRDEAALKACILRPSDLAEDWRLA